jgi:RNA 2',3'-cyclic 3'-phosphodiesterase
MRLFVALDIDDSIRDKITRFLEGVREFAPDARWVRPDSLHVTLKFIGERPDGEVGPIEKSLATIKGEKVEMRVRG